MTRKKIGLALSGGGARGFAHVGALKALACHNINFDMIAGTSAGSIAGAALATGMSPDEIAAMARKVGWLNTLRPSFGFTGLMTSAPMGKMLRHALPVTRFEDLVIPFAAVAFDIVKGEEIVLKESGDLITAIRASCAIPGIFAPIRLGDRMLIDGGVTSVLPVDAVRDMGADVVIAIDLLRCGNAFKSVPRTGLGIAVRSAMTLIGASSADQGRRCDLVIEPSIAHIRPDQIKRGDEAIRLGEEAALARVDEIKTLVRQQN
jgi:NTE family protein